MYISCKIAFFLIRSHCEAPCWWETLRAAGYVTGYTQMYGGLFGCHAFQGMHFAASECLIKLSPLPPPLKPLSDLFGARCPGITFY